MAEPLLGELVHAVAAHAALEHVGHQHGVVDRAHLDAAPGEDGQSYLRFWPIFRTRRVFQQRLERCRAPARPGSGPAQASLPARTDRCRRPCRRRGGRPGCSRPRCRRPPARRRTAAPVIGSRRSSRCRGRRRRGPWRAASRPSAGRACGRSRICCGRTCPRAQRQMRGGQLGRRELLADRLAAAAAAPSAACARRRASTPLPARVGEPALDRPSAAEDRSRARRSLAFASISLARRRLSATRRVSVLNSIASRNATRRL